jgi:hypothetical protein
MKDKIMEYLQSHYEKTKWPLVKLPDLTNHLNCYPAKELNELFIDNKISVHPGINSTLIKLII